MRSQALDRAWAASPGSDSPAWASYCCSRAARAPDRRAHPRPGPLRPTDPDGAAPLRRARHDLRSQRARAGDHAPDAASIYALPRDGRPRTTAHALAAALELDLTAIARRIGNRNGFTYIKRWVTPAQAERVRALELPGVGIDLEPRRSYPAGTFAAPLLGFANIDGQGVRGIEQLVNDWLTGQPPSARGARRAGAHPRAALDGSP